MILILLAIVLLKAAFTAGIDRRKEIGEILLALPLLLWSFLEFFMVLFKILPESKKRSRRCHRCTDCTTSAMEPNERKERRARSLSGVWSRLREANNDAEIIL